MKETHTRSMIKGVSYRILATILTMTIVFLFTDNVALSFGIGFSDLVIKAGAYYSHERLWNAITWGKT